MSEARRVLLDECVPGGLGRELPGFAVRTVREHGWASKLDGSLVREAEAEFDVLVTVDRNLVHQQNLSGTRLAIVVLVSYSNNIRVLRLLVPELAEALRTIHPGQVVHVGPPAAH